MICAHSCIHYPPEARNWPLARQDAQERICSLGVGKCSLSVHAGPIPSDFNLQNPSCCVTACSDKWALPIDSSRFLDERIIGKELVPGSLALSVARRTNERTSMPVCCRSTQVLWILKL